MAVKTSWSSGDVLTAADLTDTFAAKAALSDLAIVQVVGATYSTSASSSSSTYSDTGLTATITPSSASNKVLAIVMQGGVGKTGSTYPGIKLFRDAIEIAKEDGAGFTNTTAYNFIGTVAFAVLDTPATTSAITYKTQFNSMSATASATVQNAGSTSTIVLMEVAA